MTTDHGHDFDFNFTQTLFIAFLGFSALIEKTLKLDNNKTEINAVFTVDKRKIVSKMANRTHRHLGNLGKVT
jgi:hypothetical protein